MTTNDLLTIIRDRFKEDILAVTVKSDKRAFVSIRPELIVPFADYLFQELQFRFIIASALQSKKGFEIYYHFSKDEIGFILNVHVILPEEKPEIESLANNFVAANWIEREIHELFGINFLNHPNLDKLISEGNWAEGVYPYRNKEI